ncbi:MAG: hypothetical protein HC837_18160 [Chloroflexaceae bacterium]|nr:hypothetical protein [Chloroflexaceae bacterium]
MIDFPIADLLDDAASTQWLEQHLNPNGLYCPLLWERRSTLLSPAGGV